MINLQIEFSAIDRKSDVNFERDAPQAIWDVAVPGSVVMKKAVQELQFPDIPCLLFAAELVRAVHRASFYGLTSDIYLPDTHQQVLRIENANSGISFQAQSASIVCNIAEGCAASGQFFRQMARRSVTIYPELSRNRSFISSSRELRDLEPTLRE